MKRFIFGLLLATICNFPFSWVLADNVPHTISYQARLTNNSGQAVPDGNYSVTFTIYDAATGGTAWWTETRTVATVVGLFSVQLGSINPISGQPQHFGNQDRWLGIKVGADPEVLPRSKFTSVPYALIADQAPNYLSIHGGTVDGAISGVGSPSITMGKGNFGTDNSNAGDHSFVAGWSNSAPGMNSVVSGGDHNQAYGSASAIGGGGNNTTSALFSTIGGGTLNSCMNDYTTVAGGRLNFAYASGSIVGGGVSDTAFSYYSGVFSGQSNTAGTSGALDSMAVVAGGFRNMARNKFSFIGGGLADTASADYAVVSGGNRNVASGSASVIGGGVQNIATNNQSTIAGGQNDTVTGQWGTIGGGAKNFVGDEGGTVAGGVSNRATGWRSSIGGGDVNSAAGWAATVPGGLWNSASGALSFAVGHRAKATHEGAFVWGDATDLDVGSFGNNTFTARSVGGVKFFTNTALTAGVQLAAGGGSWSSVSDRNVKHNVQQTDGEQVLARLDEVSVPTWTYNSQSDSIRHIGPMAQDFYKAFGVGEDSLHITSIDADGVALAAIKELHKENLWLRDEVDKLKALVHQLASEKSVKQGSE